jgi:hypothetical protein
MMFSVGLQMRLSPADSNFLAKKSVFFMHRVTIFWKPSLPKTLKTAHADAAEAPALVPTNV